MMKPVPPEVFYQKYWATLTLPFCYAPGFLKMHTGMLILSNTDEAFALLQLTTNKGFKTARFYFPPLDKHGKKLVPDQEVAFCEEAIRYLTETENIHRIMQPVNYCVFQLPPGECISVPFGTYKIELTAKTPQSLLAAMQPRYRTAIAQARRMRAEVRYGRSELNAFARLHEKTMQRSNSWYETSLQIEQVLDALKDNALLATVYINNELQGGLLLHYSTFGAYYMHGASADHPEASGAIKFLHYEVMCRLLNEGVAFYDFVGARLSGNISPKLKGIQDFKRRFGSELESGYLWKKDLNTWRCNLYDLILYWKCKLKHQVFPEDIIEQERRAMHL